MESKLKFLIVDDDVDDTDLFCEAIHEIDPTHDCVAVHDCEEALVRLGKKTDVLPNFIFLDLNMPGMDGKTCLKEIKKTCRLKEIPVIMYSTSINPEDIEEMLQLGAAHFLTKATSFGKMVQGIRKALNIISR